MSKTILVTGDVVLQENLLVGEKTRANRPEEPGPLTLVESQAGAWWAAELARVAIESPADAVVIGPRRTDAAARAFAHWKAYQPDTSEKSKDKDKLWRVEKWVGVHKCSNLVPLAYEGAGGDQADVLLIEDLNLGFRDHPELWPIALQQVAPGTSIVLRSCAPVCGGALWKHLFAHRDQVTVVVPADALRARGVGLTAPLSWDQTIEEVTTEFEGTRFANDLAGLKRVIVQFAGEGAAAFTRVELLDGSPPFERVCFERCLYDPKLLEGAWAEKRAGHTTDGTAILAAAMVRHELDPSTYPLFVALGRGLAAIRKAHEIGGGPAAKYELESSARAIGSVLHPADGEPEPAADYCTAFPHSLLDDRNLCGQPVTESDLLRDFTGFGLESVVSTGIDVVLRGLDLALKPVPRANYGKYTTVDRDEIERINAIRNLIRTYLANPIDTRPLSFAVFGPPGSGKSFAVKQLMKDIAGDTAVALDINLSQIKDDGELHQAFHRVRDASIKNRIPFVFWDEFDTSNLEWLKHFLAPMQDAVFQEGGVQHDFGKAIFIFAGGTTFTFKRFVGWPQKGEFKSQKGPDFVSRLRGHIDVKGPNPDGKGGHAHVIRRAILLRKQLEDKAPHLIDSSTKEASVDAGIIRAFLTAKEYTHGARSLESVVTMSNLTRAHFYGLAELPTRDLLDMHVSADFEDKARKPAIGLREIDELAAEAHEAWATTKRSRGVVPGPKRDDHSSPPTHPLLVEFDRLPDAIKESNRASVRAALVVFANLGYEVTRIDQAVEGLSVLDEKLLPDVMSAEHDRWMRERLQTGWAWCAVTNDKLRLHKDAAHFKDLPPGEQPLDKLTYETVLKTLPGLGFTLTKSRLRFRAM